MWNTARAGALGEITDRNNADILMELFNESVPGAKIENYTNAEGTTLDNYYTILLSQVDFKRLPVIAAYKSP